MTTTPGPSHDWEQLVAACMLGSSRSGTRIPAIIGAPAALLDRAPSVDAPRALLRAAAVLCVYEKAGRRRAGAGGAALPACAADDLPPCSAAAAQHLARILHGEFGVLLEEWCTAAASRGLRAPSELLPALLGRLAAASTCDNPAAIRGVLGRRGAWLASLNPAWQPTTSSSEDPITAWRVGTQPQRLAALHALRETDPRAARDLVAASWPQESPDDRAAIVEALATNLSPDDEPFLEVALDDKRKPVRQAASDLLARLPASAFCQRMTARAAAAVTVEPLKKSVQGIRVRLEITLPEKPDKAAQRDGLEHKRRGGMGERANLLCQILAAAPLSMWDRPDTFPVDLIGAANQTDWCEPLARGWTTAAIRQHARAWAEALFESAVHAQADADFDEARTLLQALGAEARERVLTPTLCDTSIQRGRSLRLLEHCPHDWSTAFSRAALAAIKRHFGTDAAYTDHALRDVIKRHVPLRIQPSLAAEAEQGWNRTENIWHKGDEEMVTTLAATLAFRRAMLEELQR